jgi:hypothetical protein
VLLTSSKVANRLRFQLVDATRWLSHRQLYINPNFKSGILSCIFYTLKNKKILIFYTLLIARRFSVLAQILLYTILETHHHRNDDLMNKLRTSLMISQSMNTPQLGFIFIIKNFKP